MKRIQHILVTGRGFGRTEAILNGAKTVEGCVVVAANEMQAAQMRKRAPEVKVISLQAAERLRGSASAILFDHQAYWEAYKEGIKEAKEDGARDILNILAECGYDGESTVEELMEVYRERRNK